MVGYSREILAGFLLSCTLFLSVLGVSFDAFAAEAEKVPFLPQDDLSLIREKIAANGYNFTVASNWVVELTLEKRARMRSRFPVTRAQRERRSSDPGPLALYLDSPLPKRFDWRNVDNGISYIGPVRHQGSCGACYAFGACAAAEGVYNLANNLYNDNCVDFSEAFITFCLDPLYAGFDGCTGSDYEYEELDALVREGLCLEELFPYDASLRSCPLDLPVSTVKFDSWHRLPCNDIDAIKRAIRYFGIVDVSVMTNSAFDAYESGVYEDSKTECRDTYSGTCYYAASDHVVALVGWDDNGGDGYWILRNSWGADWGEDGYMRIKYNSAHVACAACYLVITADLPVVEVEPAAVAPWLPLLLKNE